VDLELVTAALDADVQKASLGGRELWANENDVQQPCHECLNIARLLSKATSCMAEAGIGSWKAFARPFKLSGPRMRLNYCVSDWMDIDNN
jgi:hypothetical protein